MRVAIVGATGNIGTSTLTALADEPAVDAIVGLSRRRPALRAPKTTWAETDIADADLSSHLAGADALVHAAWLIQPSRSEAVTHATNVTGSARLFDAAARAGVRTIVYLSSVGAYSPGPKDRAVDESWPTNGIPTSFYSRHKAAVERVLDSFEAAHPDVRVVRLRPGLVFKREAGAEVRRLFAGPLVPSPLLRPDLVPLVPDVERLRFQAVHSLDVGQAVRLGLTREVHGAFNVAAEPVLDPDVLARLLGARTVGMPRALLRGLADLSWRLRLQPTPPGWLDLALGVPVMSTRRAREELGWAPRHDAGAAFVEVLEGMRDSAGLDTPPLRPRAGGPLRLRELLSGVGGASR